MDLTRYGSVPVFAPPAGHRAGRRYDRSNVSRGCPPAAGAGPSLLAGPSVACSFPTRPPRRGPAKQLSSPLVIYPDHRDAPCPLGSVSRKPALAEVYPVKASHPRVRRAPSRCPSGSWQSRSLVQGNQRQHQTPSQPRACSAALDRASPGTRRVRPLQIAAPHPLIFPPSSCRPTRRARLAARGPVSRSVL